jgi:2-polyprenyl-6-methoxyphenol hydroxylase-like FAD-dependent oxidoreductase
LDAAHHIEAIIIGGGPAGLAAALSLKSAGIESLVIERQAAPIDKACGEGLMPDALDCLGSLGIEISSEMGAPFAGITFVEGASSVSAAFPRGRGVGMRRLDLHRLLEERCRLSDIPIFWNTRANILDPHRVQAGNTVFECKWLIGADGQNSFVRRFCGLEATSILKTRYGFRRHYRIAPWTDHVEVHWSDRGQMYITPIAKQEICVAYVSRQSQIRFDDALRDFDRLPKLLSAEAISSQERGCITTTRKLKNVYRDSVALIGDASGSVDAVTGEGLALAFRQAACMAEAVKNNRLAAYQSAHEEINRLPAAMSRLLLFMDEHPALRKRVFPVLAQTPDVFRRLLSVHMGHGSLTEVVLQEAPALGWEILTGA